MSEFTMGLAEKREVYLENMLRCMRMGLKLTAAKWRRQLREVNVQLGYNAEAGVPAVDVKKEVMVDTPDYSVEGAVLRDTVEDGSVWVRGVGIRGVTLAPKIKREV